LQDKSELDFWRSAAMPIYLSQIRQADARAVIRYPALNWKRSPNQRIFEDSFFGQITRTIQIPTPAEGSCGITARGLGTGKYQLSIRAFSLDGHAQPEILKEGDLTQGSQIKLKLQSTKIPGEASVLKVE
jgi:hypothetical protein